MGLKFPGYMLKGITTTLLGDRITLAIEQFQKELYYYQDLLEFINSSSHYFFLGDSASDQ